MIGHLTVSGAVPAIFMKYHFTLFTLKPIAFPIFLYLIGPHIVIFRTFFQSPCEERDRHKIVVNQRLVQLNRTIKIIFMANFLVHFPSL